jgi:carbonic anhydrase
MLQKAAAKVFRAKFRDALKNEAPKRFRVGCADSRYLSRAARIQQNRNSWRRRSRSLQAQC